MIDWLVSILVFDQKGMLSCCRKRDLTLTRNNECLSNHTSSSGWSEAAVLVVFVALREDPETPEELLLALAVEPFVDDLALLHWLAAGACWARLIIFLRLIIAGLRKELDQVKEDWELCWKFGNQNSLVLTNGQANGNAAGDELYKITDTKTKRDDLHGPACAFDDDKTASRLII